MMLSARGLTACLLLAGLWLFTSCSNDSPTVPEEEGQLPPPTESALEFVVSSGAPSPQVSWLYFLEDSIEVFLCKFGPQGTTLAGSAWGLRRGAKIGWMRISSGTLTYAPDSAKHFDVSALDGALLSDALWFDMRASDLHEYWFWSSFLSLLAGDPDTDRIALIRIAAMLHTYIASGVAERLLENPMVQIDRDILTLLATLPVFRGDAYAQVRAHAQEYLNALG